MKHAIDNFIQAFLILHSMTNMANFRKNEFVCDAAGHNERAEIEENKFILNWKLALSDSMET